jgi:hypothetical protein
MIAGNPDQSREPLAQKLESFRELRLRIGNVSRENEPILRTSLNGHKGGSVALVSKVKIANGPKIHAWSRYRLGGVNALNPLPTAMTRMLAQIASGTRVALRSRSVTYRRACSLWRG